MQKTKLFTTRNLVTCGMLSAMAGVLMLLEFPLPFMAPPFYELDLSEIPALIGAFSMGPVAGIIIEFIKIVIKLIIKGTSTAFVGDIANFVIGCIFVTTASVIYKLKKDRAGALIGMGSATGIMSLSSTLVNAFIMIPLYSSMFNLPLEQIINMGNAVNPNVNNLFTFCLICVFPFNLLKGIIVSAVTFFIYKPLQRLIRGKV